MPAAMIAFVFPERKKLPILRKSKYQEFQCRKRHMFVATDTLSIEDEAFGGFNAASGLWSLQLRLKRQCTVVTSFNAASSICSLQQQW